MNHERKVRDISRVMAVAARHFPDGPPNWRPTKAELLEELPDHEDERWPLLWALAFWLVTAGLLWFPILWLVSRW